MQCRTPHMREREVDRGRELEPHSLGLPSPQVGLRQTQRENQCVLQDFQFLLLETFQNESEHRHTPNYLETEYPHGLWVDQGKSSLKSTEVEDSAPVI